jgi:predicted phage terminase large subunit-like protein
MQEKENPTNNQIAIALARRVFADFVKWTKSDYQMTWYLQKTCDILQQFAEGKIKKLMLFMPPQHGKSELVSRKFPAFLLGRDPSKKIATTSYSGDKASEFNKDVRRVITSNEYQQLFPRTKIASQVTGKRKLYTETDEMVQIVDNGGFYKSVGIMGPLTGTPVDVGIIDDPIKDSMDANSETYRNRAWDWYVNVFLTRLHNDSQQIIIMTRWHEDDLAGRILESEGNEWTQVIFPALKEGPPTEFDPRQEGEALWPEKHSLEKILKMKEMSPTTFLSLLQQRPTAEGGNLFKQEWFKRFNIGDFVPNTTIPISSLPRHFYSDTAYGKAKSDNSATTSYSYFEDLGLFFIWGIHKVNLTFPQFKTDYQNWVRNNGYDAVKSMCYFEPKSTGISTVQELKATSDLNVREDEPPTEAKETRIASVTPRFEAGRVFFLNGMEGMSDFETEAMAFPKGKNDDCIDCVTSIILRELRKKKNLDYGVIELNLL